MHTAPTHRGTRGDYTPIVQTMPIVAATSRAAGASPSRPAMERGGADVKLRRHGCVEHTGGDVREPVKYPQILFWKLRAEYTNHRCDRFETPITPAVHVPALDCADSDAPETEDAVKVFDQVELLLRRKGSQVHAIAPDSTVYEALAKMAEYGIGALVVMDGAELVGIFSERDYARKVILAGRSSKETKVQEIMSSSVVTVSSKATVDDCMKRMTRQRCRHLPVIDGGRVVGVVSIGDVVQWIIKAQDVTIRQLEDYIAGRY